MRPDSQPPIERLDAEATRPLRRRVLRPNQPVEACVYPLDAQPQSGHFGIREGDQLIGVASIYHEAPEGEASDTAWRIRGMAVLPECRGRGLGLQLLDACLDHARSHGGRSVWCNARTTVIDFYQRGGLRPQGEEFELPGIGPHYVMQGDL